MKHEECAGVLRTTELKPQEAADTENSLTKLAGNFAPTADFERRLEEATQAVVPSFADACEKEHTIIDKVDGSPSTTSSTLEELLSHGCDQGPIQAVPMGTPPTKRTK
eukprot:2690148-Prorocentrum_lima.AAC.1